MDQQIEAIYAVRKGKDVSNCLFFSWEDAQLQIENQASEWKRFANNEIQSAMEFLKPSNNLLYPNIQLQPSESVQEDHELNQVADLALAPDDILPKADEGSLPPLNIHAQPILTHEVLAEVTPLECNPYPLSATENTITNDQSTTPAIDMNMHMNMNMNMHDANIEMDMNNVTELEVAELETFAGLPSSGSTVNTKLPSSSSSTSHKRKRQGKEQPFRAIDKPPAKPWLNMRNALKAHKDQTGSLYIDPKNNEKSPLRRWVSEQRHQYNLHSKSKKTFMTPSKIKLLTLIGFDFMDVDNQIINSKPGPREDDQGDKKWEEVFAALIQYKKVTGSVNVKRCPENRVLYNWVMSQRVEYKKLATDGRSKLTAAKIQKLNDAGFTFAKRPKYLKWEDRLDQLKDYKIKHGHLKIPINDPILGEFSGRQRSEYTKFLEGKKDQGMNEMRVKELTDLGFVFLIGKRVTIERRMTKRKTWDERFQELIEFKEEYAHTLVPQHSVCGLGEWVHQVCESRNLCIVLLERSSNCERGAFLLNTATQKLQITQSRERKCAINREGNQAF